MPSISEECPHYGDACALASQDESFFSTFKRNNFYRAVLEHVSEEQGLMYYSEIDSASDIRKNIQKVSYPKLSDLLKKVTDCTMYTKGMNLVSWNSRDFCKVLAKLH